MLPKFVIRTGRKIKAASHWSALLVRFNDNDNSVCLDIHVSGDEYDMLQDAFAKYVIGFAYSSEKKNNNRIDSGYIDLSNFKDVSMCSVLVNYTDWLHYRYSGIPDYEISPERKFYFGVIGNDTILYSLNGKIRKITRNELDKAAKNTPPISPINNTLMDFDT